MSTDFLRALSEENHRIHGVANQPPIDALAYLLGVQVDAYDTSGEVGELREALIAWYRDPCAETIAALEAEAADCLMILDHIVAMCGGRPLIDCVRDKVAADQIKHQPCPIHGTPCPDPDGCVTVHQAECATHGLPLLATGGEV